MKTITEKLGLEGKITIKHSQKIEEIIQGERRNERKRIKNKIQCAGFSEDPDFECKKVLPINEMFATVKNPNKFYCGECYKRGLDMEYEAMGL